ncbi:hypothetical protein CRE_31524 [Caenorhabditis remanei]|uniref:F-box domain-containing protein n=1 Tax=Caenorhabditis remanei TaxID=31234 RepID=E3NGG6_CAERE|nr:hypothetical protein CRE_31524 [Caenorhabditis remanei]
MSSPFPLLRLPRLVLCEVFKSLSIGEKIKLSLCSKRISTQINNDRLYSQKVIVNLHDEKIKVHFENDRDTFEIFISPETKKTRGSVFNLQDQKMKVCCLTSYPVALDWLRIFASRLVDSAWFTLEYLLECASTKILLWQSHLENKNLDEVLRKWRAGELPNLKYLNVKSNSITNNGTTILGMKLSELAGKVIQTDDGTKKAIIKLDYYNIQISVAPFNCAFPPFPQIIFI